MLIYIHLSLFILLYKSFQLFGFVEDWVWVYSPCICKCKWFSFHLIFSEFDKILNLVGQNSKHRLRGPNHYKLSVLNFSLSLKSLLGVHTNIFLQTKNTLLSSLTFLIRKIAIHPPLANSKGPNMCEKEHIYHYNTSKKISNLKVKNNIIKINKNK